MKVFESQQFASMGVIHSEGVQIAFEVRAILPPDCNLTQQ